MQTESNGQNQLLDLLSNLGIKNPATKKTTHLRTVQEMEDLRLRQASGEPSKKMKGNINPSYEIDEHNQHMVHVYLENVEWAQNSGAQPKKISMPGRLHMFYPNEFDIMKKNEMRKGEKGNPQNAFGSYTIVKVVHDPRVKSVRDASDFDLSKKDGESGSDNTGSTMASENADQKQLFLNSLQNASIEELRAAYAGVTKEDADENMTAPQLISAITDALEAQV